MDYKAQKYDPISINLLFTYLSILIVPLIAILVIYMTANRILVDNQMDKIENNLLQTSGYISDTLRDASNLAIYISDSKEIRDLLRSESSYFDFFKYVQDTTEYNLINNAIQHVYIFFADNKYIIKDKTVVPAKDIFYRSIDKLDEKDLNSFLSTISQSSGSSLSLSSQGKKLYVMQKFPYTQYENYKGLIAIVLNDKILTMRLAENHVDDYGIALMLNRSHEGYSVQNYSIGKNEKLTLNDIDINALLSTKSNRVQYHNSSYILNKYKDSSGFTYLNLVPLNVVLARVSNIKFLIVLLSIASVILALSICVVLWRRRRNILLRISSYKHYFEYSNNADKPKNIWDSISYMMDSIVDMQNSMKLQEGFIRTSIIRKIILGLYDDEESLNKDLASIKGKLDSKRYIVASLNIKYPDDSSKNKDLRLLLSTEFKNFEIYNLYCELAADKIAVIFFVKSESSIDILIEKLQLLKNRLYDNWRLVSYIGIGKEVAELLEVATSYDSARKTSDYLYYNDMRTIMRHDDLRVSKDVFFYPIESELHLIKAIKTSNLTDARDILRVLYYENYSHRSLSSSMNQNFISMLKASLIRELENTDEYAMSIEELRSLNQFDEIAQYIEALIGNIQDGENERYAKLKQSISLQMEQHYSDPNYTLFALSREVKVPETRLYKIFKEIFSMSFSEYLENLRITKACELLRGKVQIKDIAAMVGYGSDFSFRRAFKRSMGIPPSYYSEGLKKNSQGV